ncbi:leucyl/phenylalanyl-tRNA--protein transferase [Pseudoalteromonas sp. S4488]|uniref:leucyl/phenylalanyl-tRNA--protein transferase n=1 Tax=unclassified Pseudoalteromonas TaxID=194690 RepID=UPI001022D2F5|nr:MULTISPECIES: leucyl/phenylalanyl-tRNA--protein transferase [unclassified Pseudoalteromonas]RZF81333.1 leucyl/phenylalanyl-tRNA--protein transferase [Pseudoalteromonas sp. CO109Y]TMO36379.1 leucyl/phenylalanyl-tRNA--protein transferase [Pseudoalteromonas sp. S4491]TMO37825.1 leucyl/phenylalanyl-tRNA--protein transferase [Pseudoalteromonas sp. S4488]
MIKQLYQLSPETVDFPDPELSLDEPDGLLAIGGDLSVERIKNAYNTGIFPWFSDYEPIMWWSPSMRGVIELNEFHVSRSLKKHLKRFPVRVTINHAFSHVINACREQRIDAEGTWITEQMMHAYIEAHHQGLAHSLEIWHQDELVAGLYGIMQNGIFCGESMFHQVSNGSKLAMWALVNWLKKHQAHFIDCQLENPYLITLGAKVIPRREFLTRLKLAHSYVPKKDMWHPQELINIYD